MNHPGAPLAGALNHFFDPIVRSMPHVAGRTEQVLDMLKSLPERLPPKLVFRKYDIKKIFILAVSMPTSSSPSLHVFRTNAFVTLLTTPSGKCYTINLWNTMS